MRRLIIALLAVWLLCGALGGMPVHAHQTQTVGPNGEYLVIVGFEREPIFTDERNAVDVIVRRAADREPVEHLEQTLFLELIAPDGAARRELPLRARHGQPGYYTADVLLTQPGVYTLRVWGHIFDVEFEAEFHTHDVAPLAQLRFP